jgi:hypothetical protein
MDAQSSKVPRLEDCGIDYLDQNAVRPMFMRENFYDNRKR